MPNRENSLKKRTFTGQDELAKHIYNILTDPGSIKIQRVAKTIGLLLEHLRKSGILSDKDIDDILVKVVSTCAESPIRAQNLNKNPGQSQGYTLP